MANTTNFGWETPDDTDLVKDGAAAMRTLGNAIDTSLVDLKGGTTGQVLSKASNTDMDFTWVAQDDSNAIQNAIVDAKGDIITATAADTPARLAVGSSGNLLVADSSAATGLAYSPTFFAGKNKIINGDFGIWQRGTSFSNPAAYAYNADRWQIDFDGTGATRTISQQIFTPGTAPVSGYEGQYFLRFAITAAGTGNSYQLIAQRIEDVRTFAGQTVTLSFWAKADSARTVTAGADQQFGSGGSSPAVGFSGTASVTTSWQRFSITGTLPSISGKTIGTGSFVNLYFKSPANGTSTIDYWGVQVEAGSTATQFQTATGNIQAELAACQRYYFRTTPGAAGRSIGSGYAANTTIGYVGVNFPVTMRIVPTALEQSGTASDYSIGYTTTDTACSSVPAYFNGSDTYQMVTFTVASGLTAGHAIRGRANATGAYLAWSAEL